MKIIKVALCIWLTCISQSHANEKLFSNEAEKIAFVAQMPHISSTSKNFSMHMKKILERGFLPSELKNFPPQKIQQFRDEYFSFLEKFNLEKKLIEIQTDLTVEIFSDSEIMKVNEFYKTDIGKKVLNHSEIGKSFLQSFSSEEIKELIDTYNEYGVFEMMTNRFPSVNKRLEKDISAVALRLYEEYTEMKKKHLEKIKNY